MSAVLERMARRATLLQRPTVVRSPMADVMRLSDVEAQRWLEMDAALRVEGKLQAGRNYWVAQLPDMDPRGTTTDGLTLASFTTSAAIFPPFTLPANFWRGRMLHLRARGIWAATATPTYTFRLQQTSPAAVTIVTSAAITVSALTNQQWELDIQTRVHTEGTAGSVRSGGDLNLAGVTGTQWLPAAGTAPTIATIDTTVAEIWQVEVACSVSNAANTVTGITLEVKSIN